MGRKTARNKRFKYESDSNVVEMFPRPEPKRKKWSQHDLNNIKALNANQADFLEGWFTGNNVCAHGSAGSGKTFLAVYAALTSLLDDRDNIQRVIIVRSAVATRDIGHLPGTVEEKQAVYENPYHDIFSELMGRAATYQDMKDAHKVEFMLTSNVRGLTWDNAAIIVDEAQNMTMMELDSVVTRVGNNSRLIMVGDTRYQQDLKRNEVSGFTDTVRIMSEISDTTLVQFTSDDIVRSAFVRSWIKAREVLNV